MRYPPEVGAPGRNHAGHLADSPLARTCGSSERVPEVGRTVAHAPEFLRGVARNALLGRVPHKRLATRINALVCEHRDRHGDEPNPDEHELDTVCAPPVNSSVKGKEENIIGLTSEDVARGVLGAVDVARDRAAEVPDADVQRHAHAALVVPRQVVTQPAPSSASQVEGGTDKEKRYAPRDDPGEAGVRACDDEEGAEVLRADRHVADVDHEADEAECEAGEHERVPCLDAVGPDGPDEQGDSWGAREIRTPTRK